MIKDKVIAYDLGTGGLKASLFSAAGDIVSSVFIPYKTSFAYSNWQEQAPEDWWNAIVRSTQELFTKTHVSPEEVVSLAISGHSLGVVPIGKHGQLLRTLTPLWSDMRATEEADTFFKEVDYHDWYMHTGGGFPPACYSLFKIMWYKKHEPEMFAEVDKIIGTKDYCNYRLTGKLFTDYSYASGTGAFNLESWDYEETYISAAGLAKDIFPEIVESDAVIGYVTAEAAAATGLSVHTQVVAGGVDNSCMALGAGCLKSGDAYTSLGSSAWIASVSDKPILDFTHKPYVFAHLIKGEYASATCIFSAGNSYRWVRDVICMDLVEKEKQSGQNAYRLMDELACQSHPGANGVIFNPSLAGGSMLEPSPDICGAFAGLRLGTSRSDMIRATMEGICLNLKVALDLLNSYSPLSSKMLIVGGGAKSDFWLQLFANIYNLEILKTNIDQEAATLGAAALALRGTGLWKDYSAISSLHHVQKSFVPEPEVTAFYQNESLPRFKSLTQLISRL